MVAKKHSRKPWRDLHDDDVQRPTMNKKIKVHSLTGRITPKVVRKAFKSVKRNRGASGVDKVSVAMFDSNLEENLAALMRDIKRGEFFPKPLRRVHIPKAPRSKETRPLGIPVVRDRTAQEVLRGSDQSFGKDRPTGQRSIF